MKLATDPAPLIDTVVMVVGAIALGVGVAIWGGYLVFLLFWGAKKHGEY